MHDGLTTTEKIDLAAKAAAVAVGDLDSFCEEMDLDLSTVTSWSTAYLTGGEHGVLAMVEQWRLSRQDALRWSEEIRIALRLFRPRKLRVRGDMNWFTVEEIKPLTAREVIHTPIFQIRVIEVDGAMRWFLYWRRASGDWWPYAGKASFESILAAVTEVHTDPHRCYRLHPFS